MKGRGPRECANWFFGPLSEVPRDSLTAKQGAALEIQWVAKALDSTGLELSDEVLRIAIKICHLRGKMNSSWEGNGGSQSE